MRIKIFNIILLVLFFANAKGQTITMSAPTQVCSGLNFEIKVTSTQRIYVELVYSENGINGPWIRESYATYISNIVQPGVYGVTLPRNITRTRLYKLYYWNYYDYQAYYPSNFTEITQDKWVTISLYSTPFIQDASVTQCANSQFSYAPSNGGGNIVPVGTTFTWTYTSTSTVTGATSNTITGTSNITQNVLNGTNSQTTLIYDVTPTSQEGCPGNNFLLTVLLNPAPQITSINDQVCSSSLYTKNLIDGTSGIIPAGTTYSWVNSGNIKISGQTDLSNQSNFTQTVSNSSNSTQTITYTITPTANSCAGNTFTLNLGVKPKPYVFTQSTSICSGSSFSFTPANGGTNNNIIPAGITYTWVYQPNSSVSGQVNVSTPTSNISGTILNTTISSTTQVYDVTPIANGCSGSVFQANVTLVPNPLIHDKHPTDICSGGILGNLTILDGQNGDVVPAGTSYTWNISSNNLSLTGQYASPSSQINFGQTAQIINSSNVNQSLTYTVTSASAGCSPTTFLVNLTVVPVAVIHNKTPTAICSGSSFNVPLTNGVDGDIIVSGTTYTWTTMPNAMISGATGTNTPTLSPIGQTLTNTSTTAQTVYYNVTSSSATCASTSFSITVVVNAVPSVATYTSTFCSNDNLVFDPSTINGNKVPSNTYYTWTAPVNASITGQTSSSGTPTSIVQNALVNTSSAIQSMTYVVTPTSPSSPSCAGSAFNINVIINPMPSITSSSVLNPATICSGSTMTITPTDGGGNIVPNGTTFTWTNSGNTNLQGQTNLSNQSSIIQSLTNLTNTSQTLTYNVIPTSPTTPSCSGTSFSIQQIINPIAKIASNTISICSGTSFTSVPTNTSPDIVPDGTTYTWTISSSTVSGSSAVNTPSTPITQFLTNNTNTQKISQYYVTPHPSDGCASASYTLTVNVEATPFIGNSTLSSPICSGVGFTKSPINGNGDIVPSGTTYTWTIPANSNVSGINTIATPQNNIAETPNNLTSSNQVLTYTITPTSNLGCSGQAFTLGMTILPTSIISAKTPIAFCSGNVFSVPLTDGTGGDVIPSGTQYTWSVVDNPNINGESGQISSTSTISQTLSSTSNTTQQVAYVIQPILANGCTANSFNATATINPVPKIASASESVCSNFQLNKTFTNGNGDIVPSDIEYKWVETIHDSYITGQQNQSTYTPTFSQLLSNLTGSNQLQYYTITPHTQTGCLGLDFTLVVTVKASPKIITNASGVTSCSGVAFPAFQPVDVTYGDIVPAGTQYTWTVSNNSNLNGQSNQATPQNSISQIISNTSNTNQNLTYSVRATSANACYSDFNLDFVSKPTAVIANKSYAICTNSSFDATPLGTDNIIPSGTKYTWTIGNNTNIIGAASQATSLSTISQLLKNTVGTQQSMVYHVQPVLLNNCTANAFDATINVNPLPVISIATTKTSLCIGESVTMTASGANQYSWTGGVTNAVAFAPSQTDTYTVTAIDANNCQNTASQNIEVNPLAVVASIQNGERCGPGIVNLGATSAAQAIKWYDQLTGGNLLFTGNNFQTASLSESTSYYVDATTTKGCVAASRSLVIANIKRVPIVTATTPSEVCGSGVMSLSATADVGSINWYDQLTTGTLLGSANKFQTANLTLTKNYYAEAVYNGCVSTSRATVQALVRILPTFTNTELVEVCYPRTIDISKDTLIKSSSSVLTYSYWKDATTLQTITNPTTINQTGIYYIKGTDIYNCTSTNPISLRINAQPAKMIVSDIEYCQFKTISPISLTSASNNFLRWYIDGQVYDQTYPPLPNAANAGNYLYEVSQVNNTTQCESIKSSFSVIVHKLPVISINASQNPICLNDNLTLSGQGAVSYIWNNAVLDNTPFVIKGSSMFNVIGTDQFGCQNVDSIQIKTLELPVVNTIPNVLNVCVGNTIDLTSYVNKGQSPYRYFFNTDPVYLLGNSNGKIASILNGKNTVTYYVKDANGCVSNISNAFAIGAYNPLASTFINQQAFFNEPTIIKTKLDSGYTSYTWTPEVNLNFYNDKNPIFKGETGVVYSLLRQDTVTKCTVVDTYNIDVTEEFLFYVPSAFTPNNDGLNDMLKIVKNAGILKINYFKIFNRNGTMVFSSNDINDAWDGKYMNVLQEPDAYYWVAEYVTKMNDVIRKNGNTAIIR